MPPTPEPEIVMSSSTLPFHAELASSVAPSCTTTPLPSPAAPSTPRLFGVSRSVPLATVTTPVNEFAAVSCRMPEPTLVNAAPASDSLIVFVSPALATLITGEPSSVSVPLLSASAISYPLTEKVMLPTLMSPSTSTTEPVAPTPPEKDGIVVVHPHNPGVPVGFADAPEIVQSARPPRPDCRQRPCRLPREKHPSEPMRPDRQTMHFLFSLHYSCLA